MPFEVTPELIQAVLGVAAFIGSCLGLWWRITKRLHEHVTALNGAMAALDKLRVQVGDSSRRTTARLDSFSLSLVQIQGELKTFSVVLNERDKDVSRLEGQIENLGSIVTRQVAAVSGAINSIDALWRALQAAGQVPRRLSDPK